jgi:hypothetical protein
MPQRIGLILGGLTVYLMSPWSPVLLGYLVGTVVTVVSLHIFDNLGGNDAY